MAIAIGAFSPPVAAQSSRGASPQVEALLREGLSLRRHHHDAEALGVFQHAFALSPTPRVTAQLGFAEQAVGAWSDASTRLHAAAAAQTDAWIGKRLTIRCIVTPMTQPAAAVTNAPIFGTDPSPIPGSEYEFSEVDNTVFRELSAAMRVVGVGNAVLGAVLLLSAAGGLFFNGQGAMAPGVAQSVAAGLAVVNFLWLREAAREVLAIATTQGSDITHLMHAMGALRRMFTLQRVLLAVAAVIAVPGIFVSVFLVLHTLRGG